MHFMKKLEIKKNTHTQEFPHQPFKDISVVIGQITSSDEHWNLYGFSNSWEENKNSFHIITRWQHQHVSTYVYS